MVNLAVAGGTGLAGRAVVAEAIVAGHKVRSLSRHIPPADQQVAGADYVRADFRSGVGVAEALDGVEAIIETMDARSGAALKALPGMSVAVLDSAARAGIRRCVLLTIINARECAMSYYQVQAARALSYEKSEMPTTVVEATQFHNLVAGIFSAASRMGIIPAFRGVCFQAISTADVAAVLVAEAGRGGQEKVSVRAGGPDVQTMHEMAQIWKSVTGSKAVISQLPLPGSFGAFLRAGRNLIPDDVAGAVEFREWLAGHAAG
ncbi:SDR family oxidoreductase [Arthrobacter psychrochitiniphilus]|uniref:SDR family oxidoreductase n=1 Tax=Arthrobacter psychrochitiniphilus TaxID=291045 RepID=UPI003F7C2FBE